MSDKYEVKPGGTFSVTLKRKGREEKPARRPAPPSGLVGPDEPESRYVFRGTPQIIFLDLGTRLRSIPAADWTGDRYRAAADASSPVTRDDYFDEYVEMVYERAAPVQLAAPTLAEVQALDARLLGSRAPGSTDTLDPLGTTPANVTKRKLFNCMPLPQGSFWLYTTVGVGDKLTKLSTDEGQGAVADEHPAEWTRRKPQATDARERWNSRNLSADVAAGTGILKVKGAIKRLRVVAGDFSAHGLPRAVGAYEEFDTDDSTNFKITTEPRSDAPAAALKLASSSPVRVYLKPRLVRRVLSALDTPFSTFGFMWDGRVPVYPDLWLIRNISSVEDVNARAMCALRRSPLASAYYDEHPPPSGHAPYLSFPSFIAGQLPPILTPAGALSAVVAQGSKVFYVWRSLAREIDFGVDGNPFVGAYPLDTPCS